MAGYIGTKAVNLSTTGADIAGDADVSGALDVGGAFTSQGIDDNATSTAMTLDASGNVGIGSSPDQLLTVGNTSTQYTRLQFYAATNGASTIHFGDSTAGANPYRGYLNYAHDSDSMQFATSNSEAMRIDASGNLLVGKTSVGVSSVGAEFRSGVSDYSVTGVSSSQAAALFGRNTNDGDILRFRKDNVAVGSIGSASTGTIFIRGMETAGGSGPVMYIRDGNDATILTFGVFSSSYGYIGDMSGADVGIGFVSTRIEPINTATGARADNVYDLGGSNARWDDIFATNGTIQTSDRNEKQDIAELSDAEQRVAVASKGLMRKFRWRDAVEAKGDDARTHFGIIAQDLQAAFAAEGLDAGDYAMFISTTWWETQTEVPAVEAVAEVLDEEGNVVTEAVEAVDAYTRTDTYDTQEEAPEGATERTRLGVRYSELLAFIIGAL